MPYVPALDGLRSVAIALVLLFHAEVPGVPGGNLGVDVFLVLSGYLITSLLYAEYQACLRINLRNFYWRRLWRLMPPLLLLLGLYAVVAPIVWPDYPFHLRDVLALLFYLGNVAMATGYSPDKLMHGWSLGLEEQFYLLWPVLVLALWRRFPAGACWKLLLLMFVLLSGWRLLNLLIWQVPSSVVYYRPDTHATGLVLGAALAMSGGRGQGLGRVGAIAAYGLLLLTIMLPRSPEVHLAWFVPLGELSGALIILSIRQGGSAWLQHPVLVHVGKMSYGLYLFHYPIMKYMTEQQVPWYWVLGIGCALSYLLAAGSYYSIERFVRRYRQRYQVVG